MQWNDEDDHYDEDDDDTDDHTDNDDEVKETEVDHPWSETRYW